MVGNPKSSCLPRFLATLVVLVLMANRPILADVRDAKLSRILHMIAGDDLKSFFGFTPQLSLIQSASPNAFAVSPNQILITTRLLDITDKDEDLSFVIAHEISHLMLQHHPYQRSALLPQAALAAIDHELTADRLAISLLTGAGVPTNGVANFLKSLQSATQKTSMSLTFRIAALGG